MPHQVNIGVLNRLRNERAWTIEELAGRARCSTRTINSVLAGRLVAASTVNKLAQAFGVEVGQLLTGEAPLGEERTTDRCYTVRIKLDVQFGNFDETVDAQPVIDWIKRILRITDEIEPESMEEKSVIIALDLSKQEAARLLREYYEFPENSPGVVSLDVLKDDLHVTEKAIEGIAYNFARCGQALDRNRSRWMYVGGFIGIAAILVLSIAGYETYWLWTRSQDGHYFNNEVETAIISMLFASVPLIFSIRAIWTSFREASRISAQMRRNHLDINRHLSVLARISQSTPGLQ